MTVLIVPIEVCPPFEGSRGAAGMETADGIISSGLKSATSVSANSRPSRTFSGKRRILEETEKDGLTACCGNHPDALVLR